MTEINYFRVGEFPA